MSLSLRQAGSKGVACTNHWPKAAASKALDRGTRSVSPIRVLSRATADGNILLRYLQVNAMTKRDDGSFGL